MKNLESIKMKTLLNKFKKIRQIKISKIKLVEALPYIVAGSIALLGCNARDDKIISKIEKNDYVEFRDSNCKVYEDLGKDETLDYFYDAKKYPIVDAIEIIDSPDEAKNYVFKQILRNSDEALDLQIKFNKIKEQYNKQLGEK